MLVDYSKQRAQGSKGDLDLNGSIVILGQRYSSHQSERLQRGVRRSRSSDDGSFYNKQRTSARDMGMGDGSFYNKKRISCRDVTLKTAEVEDEAPNRRVSRSDSSKMARRATSRVAVSLLAAAEAATRELGQAGVAGLALKVSDDEEEPPKIKTRTSKTAKTAFESFIQQENEKEKEAEEDMASVLESLPGPEDPLLMKRISRCRAAGAAEEPSTTEPPRRISRAERMKREEEPKVVEPSPEPPRRVSRADRMKAAREAASAVEEETPEPPRRVSRADRMEAAREAAEAAAAADDKSDPSVDSDYDSDCSDYSASSDEDMASVLEGLPGPEDDQDDASQVDPMPPKRVSRADRNRDAAEQAAKLEDDFVSILDSQMDSSLVRPRKSSNTRHSRLMRAQTSAPTPMLDDKMPLPFTAMAPRRNNTAGPAFGRCTTSELVQEHRHRRPTALIEVDSDADLEMSASIRNDDDDDSVDYTELLGDMTDKPVPKPQQQKDWSKPSQRTVDPDAPTPKPLKKKVRKSRLKRSASMDASLHSVAESEAEEEEDDDKPKAKTDRRGMLRQSRTSQSMSNLNSKKDKNRSLSPMRGARPGLGEKGVSFTLRRNKGVSRSKSMDESISSVARFEMSFSNIGAQQDESSLKDGSDNLNGSDNPEDSPKAKPTRSLPRRAKSADESFSMHHFSMSMNNLDYLQEKEEGAAIPGYGRRDSRYGVYEGAAPSRISDATGAHDHTHGEGGCKKCNFRAKLAKSASLRGQLQTVAFISQTTINRFGEMSKLGGMSKSLSNICVGAEEMACIPTSITVDDDVPDLKGMEDESTKSKGELPSKADLGYDDDDRHYGTRPSSAIGRTLRERRVNSMSHVSNVQEKTRKQANARPALASVRRGGLMDASNLGRFRRSNLMDASLASAQSDASSTGRPSLSCMSEVHGARRRAMDTSSDHAGRPSLCASEVQGSTRRMAMIDASSNGRPSLGGSRSGSRRNIGGKQSSRRNLMGASNTGRPSLAGLKSGSMRNLGGKQTSNRNLMGGMQTSCRNLMSDESKCMDCSAFVTGSRIRRIEDPSQLLKKNSLGFS